MTQRRKNRSYHVGLIVGSTLFVAVLILRVLQPHSQIYFRSHQLEVIDMGDDDYLTTTSSSSDVQRYLQTEIVSYGGRPSRFRLPLSICEGDCDGDDECKDGLACFQRGSYRDVPGCDGGLTDSSKTDYCVPEEFVYGPMPPRPPTPVPTPLPTLAPADPAPGNDGLARIKKVGNDLDIELGLCEGDCDSDSDCRGNLECYQRRSRFEAMHGCVGGETDRSVWDYCVNPQQPPPYDPTPPSSSDVFRLKLYWQEGYFWQEETRERRWCAMYQYEGLPGNGLCWYGRTRMDCRDDQLYIAKCSKTNDPRQEFQFISLDNDEILISLAHNNNNLCWQRYERQIYLRPCDPNIETQRWFAPVGNFNDSPGKFEFSQRRFSSQCITQDHHPKAGEVVELHSCRAARSSKHETSFWNKDY